jgi:ABC-2 type transport system permease protein
MYDISTKSSKALQKFQEMSKAFSPSTSPDVEYMYGKSEASVFENLGSVFLGIIPFFLIFVVSAMSLIKERSNETLERFVMTPVRRHSVVFGYTIGYSVFASLQAVIVVLYVFYVLKLPNIGSLPLITLVMFLLSVVAVLFGFLISTFATTELQVVQFVIILIVPQIFFSGIVDVDILPYNLGNIGYFTPIYHSCHAIKQIAVEGFTFTDVAPNLAMLLAMIVFLFIVNTFSMKRYRRI